MEQVFREVLASDDAAQVQSFTYGTTPGWDSLAHMQLVSELEATFDVLLEADEVVELNDFQAAKDILGRHGVDLSS